MAVKSRWGFVPKSFGVEHFFKHKPENKGKHPFRYWNYGPDKAAEFIHPKNGNKYYLVLSPVRFGSDNCNVTILLQGERSCTLIGEYPTIREAIEKLGGILDGD